MASNVTEVILKLRDEVTARLNTIEQQVTRTGQKFESTFKGSAVNVRAFAQNIISVAQSVKGLINELGHSSERVLNFGEQFGISTDNVQKLDLAAKLAGTELESLTPLFSRLAVAQEKGDLKGRNFFETIQDVAKELNAMPPGAERAAKAIELFGRGGVRLIPVLADLEKASGKVKLISKEDLELLDQASDEVDTFALSMKNFATVLAADAIREAPKLFEKMFPFIAESLKEIREANKIVADFDAKSFVDLQGNIVDFSRKVDAKPLFELGLALTGIAIGPASEEVKPDSVIAKLLNDKELKKADEELKRVADTLAELHPQFRRLNEEQRKLLAQKTVKEFQFLGGTGSAEEIREVGEAQKKAGQATIDRENQLAADLLEIDKKFMRDKQRVREENERKAQERRDKTAGFGGAKTLAGGIEGFTDQMNLIVSEFENLQKRGADLAIDLASGLGNAFDNLFFNVAEEGFDNLTRAARNFGAEVLKMLAQIAIKQATTSLLGGIFGGLGFGFGGGPALAKGGVMPGGIEDTLPVHAFARGGIAREPTMALMGEGRGSRGEAFVPLPDGRSIPVQMQGEGGKAVGVTFNITTLDPRSFREFLVKDKSVIKNLIHEAVSSDKSFRRRIGEPR